MSGDEPRPADLAPVLDDETAERLRRLLFGGRRRPATEAALLDTVPTDTAKNQN